MLEHACEVAHAETPYCRRRGVTSCRGAAATTNSLQDVDREASEESGGGGKEAEGHYAEGVGLDSVKQAGRELPVGAEDEAECELGETLLVPSKHDADYF